MPSSPRGWRGISTARSKRSCSPIRTGCLRSRAGRESRDLWAGLLAELSPAQRTAVVLRHVDGLSYAEIAEAVGRPEGTVKAHVHRGLAALRTALLAAERRPEE